MKKERIAGLISAGWLILLVGSPALALDLYSFGSYWDKGDAEGTWGGGIGLSLPLFTDHLRLDGRVYFFDSSTFDRDDRVRLVPFDLGVQVHLFPDADLNPYGLGGVSYVYADADRSDVDANLGCFLGGGIEWSPLSIIKLYGEVLYRFQELEGRRGDDLDVSGYSSNFGVKINF